MALVTLLALGLVSPARSNPMEHSLTSSGRLLESCQSLSPALRAMCLGYLAAIIDDLKFDHANAVDGKALCLPPLVNLDLYRDAYVGFVKARPELLADPSYRTVKAALAATWPCR